VTVPGGNQSREKEKFLSRIVVLIHETTSARSVNAAGSGRPLVSDGVFLGGDARRREADYRHHALLSLYIYIYIYIYNVPAFVYSFRDRCKILAKSNFYISISPLSVPRLSYK